MLKKGTMLKYQSCNLVIFGAKGDLASRKLLPALYALEQSNKLHNDTRIIGVGRANWNKNDYSIIVKKQLTKFNKTNINNITWEKLRSRLEFCNLDFNHISQYIKLKKILNQNTTIYYFAVPPNSFGDICQGLGEHQLNHISSRIIIEKPIGISLKTSQAINSQINTYFTEKQIFRIDHYLGKETVLNLLSLRFSNIIFSTHWDYTVIDHIQITISETIGIEGRWSYFDQSGQIRDMLQNHLLQLLTLITISPPIDLQANSIQKEKIKILKALRPMNNINIYKNIVLGQYSHGI
ncbi:MAG TPA: glucose-6-phosphate dehydrogenase, partial [Buchnera sp. (in: enterobacteria)]|nr:glucose-6-phosphate dehydrogenase [Buchnera sp. (in: enterobacteria)]